MAITRSGAFIGSYGTQAAGSITFEWVPDPLYFSDKILDVKDSLEDRTVPLILSRAAIQKDIEENFEGEHDPQGQPWAPWSSTVDTRGIVEEGSLFKGYADNLPPGHSGKILNWRGILKAAATSESAFVQVSGQSVNDDSLFFDTKGLPPYWIYHQEGLPDRQTPLPQREFLGISDDVVILEIFDEWFQGILEVATSSRGKTFGRRRDPSTGRFMAAGG
jgi:hypothetical protein